jgi:hypothetical protein
VAGKSKLSPLTSTPAASSLSRLPPKCLLVLVLLASLPVLLASRGLGQAARPMTKDEIQIFLSTAKVLKSKEIGKGWTRPRRLTLSDGKITHDGLFQAIEIRRKTARFTTGGGEMDFADSFHFNIAAYRIAELLGIDDMIPVTVEREWQGEQGSLSWWIKAKWDAAERHKQNIQPPDVHAWNRQMSKVHVFSQLIYDTDRNFSNVLVTEDWKIYMIDFTRAFRTWSKLENENELVRCDRGLLSRLRQISREDVKAAVGKHLSRWEIDGLMARRDLIVEHFGKLIAEKGEAKVLY